MKLTEGRRRCLHCRKKTWRMGEDRTWSVADSSGGDDHWSKKRGGEMGRNGE